MSYHGTCAHCGQRFIRPRRQECCSRSCSAKLQMSNQNIAWTPDTEAWLQTLNPALSVDQLVAAYRQEAEKRGWPPRSRDAIRKHANRLGWRYRQEKPVVNVDTGETFPNSGEAAKAYWLHPSAIRNAARLGTLSAGFRWAYVQDLEDQRHA